MTLQEFNSLTKTEAYENLFRCCGCSYWAEEMMKHFPFSSIEELKLLSDKTWKKGGEKDWLEAFSHHPKIGEHPVNRHAATANWAEKEQSGMKVAEERVKTELAKLNYEYEKKFGYIYIVCATGKKADEMLSLLKERLNNSSSIELLIASEEQNKITNIRLDKLLS